MLSRLFGKKRSAEPEMVIIQLNARLQPMHRGEFFEDPLDAKLKAVGLGEVSGGGTMQAESGEIDYCDIELQMTDTGDEAIGKLVALLEQLGAPKGSKVRISSSQAEHAVGRAEGMAVYLNGTDLPDETYQSCDSNVVYSELDRLVEGKGRVLSYWQGPRETAFYLYGDSFADMKQRTAEFLATYPLCAKCRVTQVA
jgi:hypothetical protein